MKKTARRKLTVHRETLKTLSREALGGVEGGLTPPNTTRSGPTTPCSGGCV